jgi:hypothetical protein
VQAIDHIFLCNPDARPHSRMGLVILKASLLLIHSLPRNLVIIPGMKKSALEPRKQIAQVPLRHEQSFKMELEFKIHHLNTFQFMFMLRGQILFFHAQVVVFARSNGKKPGLPQTNGMRNWQCMFG